MIARESTPPVMQGTWDDAERLRRWAFLQRTPEQRLNWLVEILEIAYQTGALRPTADKRTSGQADKRASG